MSDDTWTSMTIADALLTLPNGKKLQQGKSPQCHKEAAPDGQWGVLKTTAIQAGRFEDQHNKLLPREISAESSIEVKAGDLLLTCAGPRNRCGVPTLVRKTRPKLLLSGKMYRFRANPRVVLPEYLEMLLLAPTTQRRIDELKTGISDSGLNLTQSRFLRMSIELPSISAQQSVVDLMASLTSRLDAGQAYAQAGAERLRLGRISAALEIFGRIDGRRILANLLTVNIGGIWGSAPGADEVDVDIFRVTELRHGGRLDQSTAAARSVRYTHLKRRELRPGDLLLEKSGGGPKQPVGRVGLVTQVEGRATCSNFMQLMRPDQSQVVPAFLHAYLTALHESGQTAALQTATTNIRNIKASEYTKLEVPWVPLAEQNVLLQELTNRYDSLARLTDAALLVDRRAVSLRAALLESLTNSPRNYL